MYNFGVSDYRVNSNLGLTSMCFHPSMQKKYLTFLQLYFGRLVNGRSWSPDASVRVFRRRAHFYPEISVGLSRSTPCGTFRYALVDECHAPSLGPFRFVTFRLRGGSLRRGDGYR